MSKRPEFFICRPEHDEDLWKLVNHYWPEDRKNGDEHTTNAEDYQIEPPITRPATAEQTPEII